VIAAWYFKHQRICSRGCAEFGKARNEPKNRWSVGLENTKSRADRNGRDFSRIAEDDQE
jgi:hypothetical protein